jgi:hypothetical protein
VVHLAPEPAVQGATGDTATTTVTVNGQNYTLPTSFGAALTWAGTQTGVPRRLVMIAPDSERVSLVNVNDGRVVPFRKAGSRVRTWFGDPADPNRPVETPLSRLIAPSDLDIDEYFIDYEAGKIILSDRPEAIQDFWQNTDWQLLVRYQIQTNKPTDVVKVNYDTRELAAVNIGVVQFTRRKAEVLPFEVAERIVVRNLKR